MNKSNKLILTLLTIFVTVVCVLGCGCNKKTDLTKNLSQLNTLVYAGNNENYDIKASYGFCEQPLKNDGIVGKTEYNLKFSFKGALLDNAEYSLCFIYNNQTYNQVFKLDNLKHLLVCNFNIDDFNLTQFEIELTCNSEKTSITMTSEIPNGTIDYKTALNKVYEKQESLLKNYYDESGNFNGEIRQRILVKDGKAYWYIGLVNTNGELKAFLVDGKSGEILAIREVF